MHKAVGFPGKVKDSLAPGLMRIHTKLKGEPNLTEDSHTSRVLLTRMKERILSQYPPPPPPLVELWLWPSLCKIVFSLKGFSANTNQSATILTVTSVIRTLCQLSKSPVFTYHQVV